MTTQTEKRTEAQQVQSKISAQYVGLAKTYPQAYKDLLDFLQSTHDMYVTYGKERSMTISGVDSPIDDHTISALLQGARVCDIVSTYIKNRTGSDVVQPIKN